MASNISEIRTKLEQRIKDAAEKLSEAEKDAAINSARGEYEQVRPRPRAKLVAGDGGFDYPVSSLTGWAQGFSVVTEVVFPWSDATPRPTVLARDSYVVVQLDGDAYFLRFFTVRPAATEQFLASYTAPHALDAGQSTIPAADDEALADLAAAYACEAIAGFFSQATEPSLAADSADHRSQGDQWRSQASRWRKAYEAKLKADAADGPAAAIGQVRPYLQPGFFPPHFHGGR